MTTQGRQIQADVVPANDEWFELEVDLTLDPIDVVTSAGYSKEDWKYLGPEFEPKRVIYHAKLVILGCVPNLEEARKKADGLGYRLLEGQAREPFKAKFPKPDGKGLIIFGGSEWGYPSDNLGVTYLNAFGDEWSSRFHWSNSVFYKKWRWLVVSKEFSKGGQS